MPVIPAPGREAETGGWVQSEASLCPGRAKIVRTTQQEPSLKTKPNKKRKISFPFEFSYSFLGDISVKASCFIELGAFSVEQQLVKLLALVRDGLLDSCLGLLKKLLGFTGC